MRRATVSAFSVVCTVLAVVTVSTPARAAAGVRTSPAVAVRGVQEISHDLTTPQPGSEPDTQVEPMIAVDPNDPNKIVSVVQQGRFPDGGSVDPGYSTSADGGRTWTAGSFNHLTTFSGGPWDRASDPWVAFGPNHMAYAVTLSFDVGPASGISVIRSDDGGLTWHDPVTAEQDTSFPNDKEAIAVDTFPSSPHFGRVYVVWDRPTMVVIYSDDEGKTWTAPISMGTSGIGAVPLVQPNGNLTVIYSSGAIVAQTSTDGGQTWNAQRTIAVQQGSDPPDMRAGQGLPGAAVDPVTGYLYAAWGDSRLRSDGLLDALLWRSVDGGKTWHGPVKANPDTSGSGITHFTVAVGVANHVVHVVYRTRQNTGGSYGRQVGESDVHSNDDGATFGGQVRLGPYTDLKYAATAGGLFLGDYMGVAVSSTGAAHPVWCVASKPDQPETYHQTTWSGTVIG